jgi:hypothetical protein
VLSANDVIDLVREAGAVLMYEAVFTPSTGSFYDQNPRRFINITSHWQGSVARVLWRSEDVLQIDEMIQL